MAGTEKKESEGKAIGGVADAGTPISYEWLRYKWDRTFFKIHLPISNLPSIGNTEVPQKSCSYDDINWVTLVD